MNRNIKTALTRRGDQGFALPVAVGTGLVMLLVGATLISRSQGDQITASARKETGGSLAVAEGGMARTLAQLTQPNNQGLLTHNYDPINPDTSKTYLGPDGILNNGDEESTAVNDWTSFSGSPTCTGGATTPNVSDSGTVGADGEYTSKAYRYNSTDKTGTFLVEGKQGTSTSQVVVTVSIESVVSDFPGVLAVEKMENYRRSVLGSNGNVYYDPLFSANTSLTGSAGVGDPNRPNYLNAIKSTVDNISGKIVACKLSPTLSYTPLGTNLGDLTGNRTISGVTGGITYYQAGKIDLVSETIDVNTTNGPVYIYVNGPVTVKGTAKIRNIRTDGVSPRVGDLRIIISTTDQIQMYGTACIENAFFYSRNGNLQMGGSGDGCPSRGTTNIDGVVWAKELTHTTGSNAGIAVPDDLSSLSDLAASIGFPVSNKIGAVKSWQRQKL